MQAAAKILGVQHCATHRLPDNRLDTVPLLDLIKLVERHIGDIAPAEVYTTMPAISMSIIAASIEAVMTACRPQPGQSVTRLLCFETPSSTEWQSAPGEAPFVPNWFVDISDVLETKMQALRAYGHEMKPWPHPRSYEGCRAPCALARRDHRLRRRRSLHARPRDTALTLEIVQKPDAANDNNRNAPGPRQVHRGCAQRGGRQPGFDAAHAARPRCAHFRGLPRHAAAGD